MKSKNETKKEELKKISEGEPLAKAYTEGDFSDDDMESVSGGCTSSPPKQQPDPIRTYMLCDNYSLDTRELCMYSEIWDGDYVGQVFECPKCKNKDFKGKNHIIKV